MRGGGGVGGFAYGLVEGGDEFVLETEIFKIGVGGGFELVPGAEEGDFGIVMKMTRSASFLAR